METCKIITFSPNFCARQKLETQRSARAGDSEIFKGQRLAKIKSNIMKGTTKLRRRTAQSATWGPHSLSSKLKVGNPVAPWIGVGWCRRDGMSLKLHHLTTESMMCTKGLIIHGVAG